MKLTVLVENTPGGKPLDIRHGLSLYLETGARRVLFDAGPDDAFLRNAQALGVDIASVDTFVLSHGHYDHGGGLPAFLQANQKARVYARPGAFDPHWNRAVDPPRMNGLDAALADCGRVVPCGDGYSLGDGLTLLSDVPQNPFPPSANATLCTGEPGALAADPFTHEQSLLVQEGGRAMLVAGCAHRGIVPIIQAATARLGRAPDAVVGGFHLYNPTLRRTEPEALVTQVAQALAGRGCRYYTCHCTGEQAYGTLRRTLLGRISYLHTGDCLTL